jgi:hypothetical protein
VNVKACTLVPDGRLLQRERYASVRGDIESVERDPTGLTVRFGPGVDERLLGELIATERECCSFLTIDYGERALRIASDDPRDLDPFEAMVR